MTLLLYKITFWLNNFLQHLIECLNLLEMGLFRSFRTFHNWIFFIYNLHSWGYQYHIFLYTHSQCVFVHKYHWLKTYGVSETVYAVVDYYAAHTWNCWVNLLCSWFCFWVRLPTLEKVGNLPILRIIQVTWVTSNLIPPLPLLPPPPIPSYSKTFAVLFL